MSAHLGVLVADMTDARFREMIEDVQLTLFVVGGSVVDDASVAIVPKLSEKTLSLEHATDTLSAEAKTHILGTQANLWAEYLLTEGLVEYQALPRLSALAEVQWTQPERKDYEAFKQRLTRLTEFFEAYHYHYAKHLWPERQLPSRWRF